MAQMMKTMIVNATMHVLRIREGSIIRYFADVPSMQIFIMFLDSNVNNRQYLLTVKESQHVVLRGDDLANAAEITVYETVTQKLEYRVSKFRVSTRGNIKGSTAFDAVKKDVYSRMRIIDVSPASLVMLLKQVKVCPAQCQNLVQTCLDGLQVMKEAYNKTSKDEVWQLFSSNKLGKLISSLDKLLSTLGSIQDLLQACGSNWGSMALVVSLPVPLSQRVYSKFDILIKELHWNLEMIHYALHLNKGMEFKWNERKFRYVLETIVGAKVMVANDMELEQSRGLASHDREHLLSQLENGPGNPLLYRSWWHLGFKVAADLWRDKLAAELQKRLKEPALLSNDYSSVPDCFWINSADLKLHENISGNSDSKSVWKGEWCGQAVAIGVTKYTTKAAVQKEAGLMLKVQHPNIVGFLGCAFTDDARPPVCNGMDDSCSAGYLVMELMHADLRHVIGVCAKSHFGSPFSLAVAVDILLQITGGMVHMHNLGIMHRDLKSANCLVNPRFSLNSSSQVLNFHALKLTDFELSKELDPNAVISNHTANTGTRRWMAPEVWVVHSAHTNNSERPLTVSYTKSADVWSFGMTCYEVITGFFPFHECRSNNDLFIALRDGERPLIPASVSCPVGLKTLMSRCWAQKPSDRPDFKDVAKDLWAIKYQLEIQ